LRLEHLQDFIKCYNPENRHNRKETERFKVFTYDEIMQRDRVSLDIFWLQDETIEDPAKLPAPELIARDITEDLESALDLFSSISQDLVK
jgi:type I restriction enzyme M protein